MDRFLMHVYISYPDRASEIEVIRLVRREEASPAAQGQPRETVTIAQQQIFDARAQIHEVYVSEAIENYIVELVTATREPARYGDDLKKWIHVGASPRGSTALDKCSRVHAWLAGQEYVTVDDVRAVVHEVLRHRMVLTYEANAEGVAADHVIRELVKQVAVV